MPVDKAKAYSVLGMLDGGITMMKNANTMLTGAQDPALAGFSQTLMGAIDMLSQGFKTLGEVLVELADDAEKARIDGVAMSSAAIAASQEAEKALRDESGRKSPFG